MTDKISIIATDMGEPRVVFKLENNEDLDWVKTMAKYLSTFNLTIPNKDGLLPIYYCVLETGHDDLIVNEFFYSESELLNRFAMDTKTDIMTASELDAYMNEHITRFVAELREYITKQNKDGGF